MRTEDTLILCTDSYPYGYGETFLETEIPILLSYFKCIYILPDNTNHTRKRETPKNVQVVQPVSPHTSLFFTLFKCLTTKEIRKEFIKNLFTIPARNKVLIKTLQWSLNKRQTIEKTIATSGNNNTILYSYWLNHAAVAISLATNATKKISRMHNWDIYETRQKYKYLPLRPFLFKNLDTIFSISQHGIDYTKIRYKTQPKFELSRLGVPSSNPKPTSTSPFSKMLSISALVPLKRIQLLKESLDEAPELNLIWEHYGSGQLYENLEEEKPDVFKGQISLNEIYNVLKQEKDHSFLINVSQYEGIPVSMMEAMSFGIPCIGTDVGGVRELIDHGYNGFLLTPNPTQNEIILTIKKIMNLSPNEALKMRKAAFQTWSSKYNAHENYKNFATKLQSMIE